ncbi:MAG TPA: EamA family transporter, partial [Polyangiaceae bacterium]|nr:EamA family transporter [Polyangiaceae bacterium]
MLALIFVSVLWAFSFGLIRHHLVSLDSSVVAWLRLVLSLLVFSPWLRPSSLGRWHCSWLMFIGAVQFGVMYLLYVASFAYLQAYQVAVLTLLTPLFICLFDAVLERRFSWVALAAAVLAAVGAMIIVASRPLGRAEWQGVLLIQLSNGAFALGQLLYRRFRRSHSNLVDRHLIPWLYLGATLIAFPFAAGKLVPTCSSLSPAQALVILYLGVGASGVGFFLWNSGAAQVKASVLSVMNNAKIPLGVLVSLLVFGESSNPLRLVCGALVVLLAAVLAERETITIVTAPAKSGVVGRSRG